MQSQWAAGIFTEFSQTTQWLRAWKRGRRISTDRDIYTKLLASLSWGLFMVPPALLDVLSCINKVFIYWLFICSTSLRAISEPERLVAQAKSQVAQTKLAYVNRAKSICIHCETFMKESMENFWNGLKMHKNLIKCFQKLNLFGSDFLCSLEAIFPS